MGHDHVNGKVPSVVGTGEGIRQHRKRLSNELNLNLKLRPLDSAVALLKSSEVSR